MFSSSQNGWIRSEHGQNETISSDSERYEDLVQIWTEAGIFPHICYEF